MTDPTFHVTRRRWLTQTAALSAAFCASLPGCADLPLPLAPLQPGEANLPNDAALLEDLQRRTFNFFWERANPANGLMPDRWPTNAGMASIASVGFALTAYVVGMDAGYITRAQGLQRALATARFFATAPQGPQASGMAGYQGFFYHFLDVQTGHRFGPRVELSSIDTALLIWGLLSVQAYFQGGDAGETELRQLVDTVYGRVNWAWMQQRPNLICMGWSPDTGFKNFIDYHGYDEATYLYLLAIASPTHPMPASAWNDGYCKTYAGKWGRFMGGQEHLNGGPLFWHQYTHCWVDFRGIQDDYMRQRGIDYFENSRRATLAQQAYAQHNPQGWNDYSAQVWGLTACDGPGDFSGLDHQGRRSRFYDYKARGAAATGVLDDGTIAPTAALGSLPFAPEVVVPTLRALRQRFGGVIYQRYGFVDAFNTSFRARSVKLSDGRYLDGFGWVDNDYIGIDQGPIVLMAANHRKALIWKLMRGHPAVVRGLKRAGFSGGWIDQA